MSDKKTKGMLLTAGFMAGATMLSKVLGLLRNSLMGAYFAAGAEADAFLTAQRLPTTLFDVVIGGVISATFIPVFNDIWTREGKDEAMGFVNKFVTLVVCASAAIALFGILFANQLVGFMAPDYSPDKHMMTVELTRIMLPMILFTGLAFSFVGLLQSFGEYNVPSIISLVSNLAIIGYFLVFGNRFGVYGLAVTMVIAWSLQLLVQVPSLVKFKVRYRPDFRFRDKHIKQAIVLALPMLVSTWAQPLYTVVNMRLASGTEGAVAMLDYANQLYIIVVGVFSFVVTNLIFPKMSRANSSDNAAEAQSLIVTSLKAIVLIITPLMAGFILLSPSVTSIIYEHGEFGPEQTSVVASVLSCYSVGMVGLAVNEILSKAFFSMQDSKTPMKNSIISMIGNIILAYSLSRFLGIRGLALAAAGGSVINALLNLWCMIRKEPEMFKKSDAVEVVKIFISAAVMAVVVWIVYRLMNFAVPDGFAGHIIKAGASAVAGAAVYAVMCFVLKIELVLGLIRGRR